MMLENIAIYLMFGMRALIFLLVILLVGTSLFIYVIPDSYNLFNGIVDLQPAKRVLFIGFVIMTLTISCKIWHKDYKRQYIPRWLR